MRNRACLLVIAIFLSFSSNAQQKFWVSFRDKANVVFDPYSYFDSRTIEQRIVQNIPLNDSTDYPVSPEYLFTVSQIVDSLSWPSRWLNAVAVYASPEEIEKILRLTFVKRVDEIVSSAELTVVSEKPISSLSKDAIGLLKYQTRRMDGESFINHNLDGTGIRIAVFDAGFPNVNTHPAFAHLRDGKKIIATYDFVRRTENVYKHHWHGTATLSCIAGKVDSLNFGLATGAEFLLARTEKVISEPFSEEENWLAAAEWADKHGANIISSSLGYTYKRYFNNQMDGHTSFISRAATIAAQKGMLVVNAAGNEGADRWHYIDTPGDADSVLCVGGTDPYQDFHIYFSSYGPASDGSLKPNVCSVGEVIAVTGDKYGDVFGTSFSTPLVAGFAACAWQSHRQWTNMELFDAIEKSAHLYPYFDFAHGFGIPQGHWFIEEQHPAPEPTFDFLVVNNEIKIVLREKYSYPETEAGLGFNPQRNFYYKIEDKDGAMKKYSVLIAGQKEMLHFFTEDFQTGDVLTVHFEGYTNTLDFPGEAK